LKLPKRVQATTDKRTASWDELKNTKTLSLFGLSSLQQVSFQQKCIVLFFLFLAKKNKIVSLFSLFQKKKTH